MKYYLLEPEVAGELGKNTVINRDSELMTVSKLHYVFSGWLGDDILECHPCFIGTLDLIKKIERLNFSGYSIADVEISTSYEFHQLYPNKTLPEFRWIQIKGMAGRDDFGSSKNGSLVVSEKVLEALKPFKISHCDIEEFSGE